MKKLLAVVLVGFCVVGCSSNDEKKAEQGRREGPARYEYRPPERPAKKVEGLHDKQLEEAGVTRDKDGNYGPGSIDKIINR